MKLYWSLKSIPELANMPKEKQKEVWRKCSGKYWRHWQTWFATIVLCIFFAAGTIGGMKYDSIFWKLPFSIIGGFAGGLILGQTLALVARIHIREYLRSHGKTI